MITNVKIKKSVISARVYRAQTGKWEDLGIIYQSKVGYYPFMNIINRIKKWLQF